MGDKNEQERQKNSRERVMRVQFNAVLKDVTRKGTKIQTDEYLTEGKFPIIDQGNNDIAGYRDDETGLFTDVPAIVFGDHTRIVKYITEPFFLGADGVKVLVPIDRTMNCKYLYYQLLSAKIPDTGYNRHFKWVKELEFQLPSRNEQDDVVKRLDKLCVVISARQQQLAKLDELVKARFVEIFGDSEYNTKHWPVVKLSDICEVGSSKRIYKNEQSSSGVPFLRISDLNERIDGKVKNPEIFISIEKYDELKLQGMVPIAGDVLVTSRGTLGRCYIVTEEDVFYFQDGMISWLSKIDARAASLYLSYLFSMRGIQKQIETLQAGSTVAYLSITMLKKLDIMLPPLELQQKFSSFVKCIDKLKLSTKKNIEQMDALKKTLMQQYFG